MIQVVAMVTGMVLAILLCRWKIMRFLGTNPFGIQARVDLPITLVSGMAMFVVFMVAHTLCFRGVLEVKENAEP